MNYQTPGTLGQISRAGRMSTALTQRIVEPIRIRERNKKILLFGGLAVLALGGIYFVVKKRKRGNK